MCRPLVTLPYPISTAYTGELLERLDTGFCGEGNRDNYPLYGVFRQTLQDLPSSYVLQELPVYDENLNHVAFLEYSALLPGSLVQVNCYFSASGDDGFVARPCGLFVLQRNREPRYAQRP